MVSPSITLTNFSWNVPVAKTPGKAKEIEKHNNTSKKTKKLLKLVIKIYEHDMVKSVVVSIYGAPYIISYRIIDFSIFVKYLPVSKVYPLVQFLSPRITNSRS